MTNLFTIRDDAVLIDTLVVSEINGDIVVKGSVTSTGSFTTGDITSQNIIANTLRVKELITETTDFGHWYAETFNDLNGKGLTWTCNEGSTQLIYRSGGRLWTSSNVDIPVNSSYMIDNISVLSSNALGSTITKSNLRQVGALNALSVIGSTSLGGFAYFDENTFRLGIGTSDPNSAISILENNVEISIGSPSVNLASVGTYSNHDLEIITDNTARIVVKHSGEVYIGNEQSKSSILKVFGTIQAESIISDTRIERTSSLEFSETRDESIYNKGLVWKTENFSKHLLMIDSPSRLRSSESIDIPDDKSYHINGIEVLSARSLGSRVLYSSLVKLGELENLVVNGTTVLNGEVQLSNLSLKVLELSNLQSLDSFSLTVNETDALYASNTEIVIGSKQNTRRPVKMFGPLSVGINNPDPTLGLSVNGDVSFNNKRFMTGLAAPKDGSYIKGDICWSQNPMEDGYVGWVCIRSGSPGEWKPFGALGA